MLLAHSDHTVELIAFFRACSGYALVGKYVDEPPFRFTADFLGIKLLLNIIAVELFFRLS